MHDLRSESEPGLSRFSDGSPSVDLALRLRTPLEDKLKGLTPYEFICKR